MFTTDNGTTYLHGYSITKVMTVPHTALLVIIENLVASIIELLWSRITAFHGSAIHKTEAHVQYSLLTLKHQ
jgi:hypothetical protein